MYWYNYKTNEYEMRETPQDFTDYVPQLPAAQGLYSLYLEMGKTPIQAAELVLLAVVGKTAVDDGDGVPGAYDISHR